MSQQTTVKTGLRSDILASAVLAVLLGAFLVLGTGFTHSNIIHNAAHDSRHSFAFPCH
ncbi:MAG: CbtB-domain containing protein [Pseudomonadota bacterium]|nr:CbtB-domain containing protein [Pseudomonadota bacterium]